jgi:hypothetical protein
MAYRSLTDLEVAHPFGTTAAGSNLRLSGSGREKGVTETGF